MNYHKKDVYCYSVMRRENTPNINIPFTLRNIFGIMQNKMPQRGKYLFVSPVGRSLGEESSHALFLVSKREHAVEDASLEAQALGQVQLVGGVDCLFGHGDGGAGEGGNLLSQSQSAL